MQYYAKIEGTDSFTNHVSNLKRDSSLSDNALQRLTTHSCETLHTIRWRSNCWCSSTEPNKTWMTFGHGQFVPFSEFRVKVWIHLFEFCAQTQQWIVLGPLLIILPSATSFVTSLALAWCLWCLRGWVGDCHSLPSQSIHISSCFCFLCHVTVLVASKQLKCGRGSSELTELLIAWFHLHFYTIGSILNAIWLNRQLPTTIFWT